MRVKRMTAAGLAAGCLGVVAAMVASAPAGAYVVPEVTASPDSSTVLGLVTVVIWEDGGGASNRYNGTAKPLGEPTEWTCAGPDITVFTPCSNPAVSVDIDLYPPTLTLTITDSTSCTYEYVALGIRIKGADFTGMVVTPGNDNIFVDPGPEPLSNRVTKPGSLSSAVPASLVFPYPTPVVHPFVTDPDGSQWTYVEWSGGTGFGARVNGTTVISLVMAGLPAGPVGAGANFTG